MVSVVVAYLLQFVKDFLPEGVFTLFSGRMLLSMFLMATLLMWGVRILVKVLYDVTYNTERAKRVLIYGVKDGGVGLAKNIRSVKPAKYVLKGFIAHEPHYKHHVLMGEKVFPVNDALTDVIKNLKIEAVLVSPLRNKEIREDEKLQDILISAGVKILMQQDAAEWNGKDEFTTANLKEVSVEDLLPRDEIKVDMESIGEQLTGKRILITGSAGSIGSEMVRQVAPYKPAAMMLIDQAETPEHDIRIMMAKRWPEIKADTVVTSICNEGHMRKIFSEFKPDYVFHAAAYKHVPMMEDNPSEAVQNNIYGTKVIADLAVEFGVKKFVMVSTDKAVNPTNVMGCSKRICEIYVQSLNKKVNELGAEQVDESTKRTQFVTTRFGNVLGSNGSVIPLFKEQLKKGGPLTVTHPNIIRFFMLIPEACKLVLEAGTKGNGGEIFVFDMGKPVRIADLAERMIRLSGAKDVKVEFTGLRAGEKLYEEVLNEEENTKPSFHEKIRIASVREYDYEAVSKDIDELIAISKNYDDMATVKKMKEIVPEFKSNNSVYEVLDR
jgi:FlaA1/EpsC-like NDP-sugar epimerase